MACPNCGCKETYSYIEDDVIGLPDDQERCAACGHIFYFEDHAEEEDDDYLHSAEIGIDPKLLLPAERECCGTFPKTPHRATCEKYRGNKGGAA